MGLVTDYFPYPYNYWNTPDLLTEYIDFRVRMMKQAAETIKELESFYTEKLGENGDGVNGSFVAIKFNTGDEYQFLITGNPDCLYTNNTSIPRCITQISYIEEQNSTLINQIEFIPNEENHFSDTFFVTPNVLFYFGKLYSNINISDSKQPANERDIKMVSLPGGAKGGYLITRLHEVYEENNRICLRNVETDELLFAAFPGVESYDYQSSELIMPQVRIENSNGELLRYKALNQDSMYCHDSSIKLPSELIEMVDDNGQTYTVLFHIDGKYIIVPTTWVWVKGN